MKNIIRKFILCFVSLLVTVLVFAQDIIITNDAKKIEAKILEVSSSEIKYKELDNLNGPTFILSTKEISSIIYSNGKVVVYNNQQVQVNQTPQSTTEKKSVPNITDEDKAIEIFLLNGTMVTGQIEELKGDHVSYTKDGNRYSIPATDIEKVIFIKNGQVREYNGISKVSPIPTSQSSVQSSPIVEKNEEKVDTSKIAINPFITRDGNIYINGNKRMNKSEYRNFLYGRCPAAYEQFSKGYNTAIAGWTLFGLGLGLDLASTIAILSNPKSSSSGLVAVSIIGGGLEIASIPTLAVGYSKMHKSVNTYNAQCHTKSNPTTYWSLQVDNYGLGLAYHF